MNLDFKINDKVQVTLKNKYYYDSHGSREIPLLTRRDMLEKLDLEDFTKAYQEEILQKKDILPVKVLTGTYVGDRPGLIKIKPFKNLFLGPYSEYFIVYPSQIKKISQN